MKYKMDSWLVHLARAGDEDACEKLVKKYYSSICIVRLGNLCRNLFGSGFYILGIYAHPLPARGSGAAHKRG